MKVAFVNLPHPEAVVRRYMCTFHTPMFSLPPYELVQLATCIREWNLAEVCVYDAIAERAGMPETLAFLEAFKPDVLVTILGLETINADMETLQLIKTARPDMRVVAFGHYATVFQKDLLEQGVLDAVLLNEPEEPLTAYLGALQNSQSQIANNIPETGQVPTVESPIPRRSPSYAGQVANSQSRLATATPGTQPIDNQKSASPTSSLPPIPGLAVRHMSGIQSTPEQRTRDLDKFPLPDFSLVDLHRYGEMLLPGPCGVIQSARGCPFPCTFCVTSHGRRIVFKSVAIVLDEMKGLATLGARHVRFVDDTFTVNRKRVLDLCDAIRKNNISLSWSCLARLDTLDSELLNRMKHAGCIRVFVGVESYSPPVLDSLGKDLDPAKSNDVIRMIKQAGLQAVGFVMVGAPRETEADFQMTRSGLRESELDLIITSVVVPYPGTPLFDKARKDIEFNLFPYVSRFKDPAIHETAIRRERDVYRHFYFRPVQMWRVFKLAVRFPWRSIMLAGMMLKFVAQGNDGKDKKDRSDFI